MKTLLKTLALAFVLTASCVAQVTLQGSNIQVGGNITGAVVPATPQFRLFIQPNAGTVSAIGGASSSQNAVTPLLQGIGNADLYSTGNNGVSQFFAAFPTGMVTVPPGSASTEVVGVPPSGAAVDDYRSNAHFRSGHNNYMTSTCSDYDSGSAISECGKMYFDANVPAHSHFQHYYTTRGYGKNLGDTGLPYAGGWTIRTANYFLAWLNTRGIKQLHANRADSNGGGDFGGSYSYFQGRGVNWEGDSEGMVGHYVQMYENPNYLHATITSASLGATSIQVGSYAGSFESLDQGYLLNISKGTYSGHVSGTSFPAVVASGTPFMAIDFDSTNIAFPVSTAWGVATAGTDSAATGDYQTPVSQTTTFTLGTLPSASGAFVQTTTDPNTSACIVGNSSTGGWTETTNITAVGSVGGGAQSVTYTTRAGYGTGFLLMQGAMCKQYITATNNPSWKTTMKVIGALSPTRLIVAACLSGNCSASDASEPSAHLLQQTILSVDSNLTLYPGAEIVHPITNNTIQVETNLVNWGNGDLVESPNGSAVNVTGQHILAGQVTPVNDRQSYGSVIEWVGTAKAAAIQRLRASSDVGTALIVDTRDKNFDYGIGFLGTKLPQALIAAKAMPSGGGNYLRIFQGQDALNNPSLYVDPIGRFAFYRGTGWVSTLTSNGCAVPTSVGQICVATDTVDGLHDNYDYTPVTVSGDCTLSQTGVMSCTTPPSGPCGGDTGGTYPNCTVTATHLSSPLPVAQGGTGTATPSLVAGVNVSITGTWPNQTISSSGGGGGTDMWWTQTVGCNVGGTVGDTCAGAVQLPSNMPDASYFLQCVPVGIAGGNYSLSMVTNPGAMPASAGVNINFEITTTASPGGSQTIQATCHAHHN